MASSSSDSDSSELDGASGDGEGSENPLRQKSASHVVEVELALQASVYDEAFLCPIVRRRLRLGSGYRVWLMLGLNFLIQCSIVAFLHKQVAESESLSQDLQDVCVPYSTLSRFANFSDARGRLIAGEMWNCAPDEILLAGNFDFLDLDKNGTWTYAEAGLLSDLYMNKTGRAVDMRGVYRQLFSTMRELSQTTTPCRAGDHVGFFLGSWRCLGVVSSVGGNSTFKPIVNVTDRNGKHRYEDKVYRIAVTDIRKKVGQDWVQCAFRPCVDTNYNEHIRVASTCEVHSRYPSTCGRWNRGNFNSSKQCCSCGGGTTQGITTYTTQPVNISTFSIFRNETPIDPRCKSIGCGAAFNSWNPCQCNVDCHRYGNCCSDYDATCAAYDKRARARLTCSTFGCSEHHKHHQFCQCCPSCTSYNNCCPDYETTCRKNSSANPAPTAAGALPAVPAVTAAAAAAAATPPPPPRPPPPSPPTAGAVPGATAAAPPPAGAAEVAGLGAARQLEEQSSEGTKNVTTMECRKGGMLNYDRECMELSSIARDFYVQEVQHFLGPCLLVDGSLCDDIELRQAWGSNSLPDLRARLQELLPDYIPLFYKLADVHQQSEVEPWRKMCKKIVAEFCPKLFTIQSQFWRLRQRDICGTAEHSLEGGVVVTRYEEDKNFNGEHGLVSIHFLLFLCLPLFLWALAMVIELGHLFEWWCVFLCLPPSSDVPRGGRSYVEVDRESVELFGIPGRHWWTSFVLNLLPRTALTCTILLVGVEYLLSITAVSDLILNCLALTFLLQVDDMLFLAFSSSQHKLWVQACKPIRARATCSGGCLPRALRRLLQGGCPVGFFFTLPLAAWLAQRILVWWRIRTWQASAMSCLCQASGERCLAAHLLGGQLTSPSSA